VTFWLPSRRATKPNQCSVVIRTHISTTSILVFFCVAFVVSFFFFFTRQLVHQLDWIFDTIYIIIGSEMYNKITSQSQSAIITLTHAIKLFHSVASSRVDGLYYCYFCYFSKLVYPSVSVSFCFQSQCNHCLCVGVSSHQPDTV
jgi:hypothetical protein